MVATFLAIGAVGFWILVSLVCLLLFIEVEYEKPGWATITCALFFGALWLFGDFNILTAVVENPLLALGCFVGYVLFGTGWSFGKWWFFVRNCRRKYDQAKQEFLNERKIQGDVIPPELRAEWRDHWHRNASYGYRGGSRQDPRPRAGDHKGRILTWMVYWPWSLVWTVINDPVKRAFKAVFYRLKAVYQRIADSVFRGVENDFADPSDGGGASGLVDATVKPDSEEPDSRLGNLTELAES